MSRRVFSGFTRVSLLAPGEQPVKGDLVPLTDEYRARSFLEHFLFDSYDMMVLRDLYAERFGTGSVSQVSNRQIIDALARSVAAGELRVVREPEFVPGGGRVERAEPEEPELAGPPVTETKHWIKFKVVDDESGRPIPGVALHVREPRGLERDYTTRPDGMIEIDEIDPGTCDVKSELDFDVARLDDTFAFVGLGESPIQPADDHPQTGSERLEGRFIAEIEEHKVQTGESIASLAQNAGITWQQFARFNWGTSVPEEINEHLHYVVGCTKKTTDGHNYMFDSSDDPGIVYVPRQWEARQLGTDRQHVFHVRQVGGFELIVIDEDDKPLAGQTVRVSQGGRDILTAVLDESGRTWVPTHQIGEPCDVDLEDYACMVVYGGLHDAEPLSEEEITEEELDGDECGSGDWDEDAAGDASETGEYLIVKGDTLSAIAARYGMNWRVLYEYDGGTDIPNSERLRSGDPDRIYVGEMILVPD